MGAKGQRDKWVIGAIGAVKGQIRRRYYNENEESQDDGSDDFSPSKFRDERSTRSSQIKSKQ